MATSMVNVHRSGCGIAPSPTLMSPSDPSALLIGLIELSC